MKASLALTSALVLISSLNLAGQGPLDPKLLNRPAVDAWPTYHGDYSGRHYSTLKEIDKSNVKALSLAWVYRANQGEAGAIMGGEAAPGESPIWLTFIGQQSIKSIPLRVNGVLYFTMPDHAWAVDARTGQALYAFYLQ